MSRTIAGGLEHGRSVADGGAFAVEHSHREGGRSTLCTAVLLVNGLYCAIVYDIIPSGMLVKSQALRAEP